MAVLRRPPERGAFEVFVAQVRPGLLQALVATYGPVDGREATVDALSWAWEHWDRLADVEHPVGYLYRVGQSATRRFLPKPLPSRLTEVIEVRFPDIEPGLLPALSCVGEILLSTGLAYGAFQDGDGPIEIVGIVPDEVTTVEIGGTTLTPINNVWHHTATDGEPLRITVRSADGRTASTG